MNKLYLGIHLNHFISILDALKETKNLGLNVLQIYMGSKILTTLREKIYLDKDQIKEIKNCGYYPYVIRDDGIKNTKFVEKQFDIFLQKVAEEGFEPSRPKGGAL